MRASVNAAVAAFCVVVYVGVYADELTVLLLPPLLGESWDSLHRKSLTECPVPVPPDRPDMAAHAYGSMLLARRYGRWPALAIGFSREASQGVGSLIHGQDFFTPWGGHGFDESDMDANSAGVNAAWDGERAR